MPLSNAPFSNGSVINGETQVKKLATTTLEGMAKARSKKKAPAVRSEVVASLPTDNHVRPRRRSAISADERVQEQLKGERQAEEDGLASPL